jgi:hypothetical protein
VWSQRPENLSFEIIDPNILSMKARLRACLLPLCLIVSALTLHAQLPGKVFPGSKPENGPAFNMATWLRAATLVDHDTWNKNHPGPYNTWFSPDSDECATKYEITWGPLGIRTLMHDHTWANLPAFRRAWPKSVLDEKGDLIFDCFEVVAVIPGSPADGHLQKGDLLVAMDGDLFRTALALRPQAPVWQFQESRGLEMDAGEKLDRAEGRGRVSFDVIRPGSGSSPVLKGSIMRELQVTGELRGGGLKEVELDVPVIPGQELTLCLDLTRDGNGSCGAELIQPRLEGAGGSLDLSALRRSAESNGWGKITRGADSGGKPIVYKGKPEDQSIWAHAPAQLGWTIPEGYTRFRATLVGNPSATGYRARVMSRLTPRSMPAVFQPMHQVVSFNIPKIGNYVRGFPNKGDTKSALVAKMTAAWLAGQQQEDGSWKRTCGYTHNGYDTAWAGLGLLAQGDPAFDSHIRKAAEFLAFRSAQDRWVVPNSMMIAFLAEYWLKTKDDRILIALQTQVERLQTEMVYGDWNSGHGDTPGYAGTGVSIGGSHLALAMTLANLTPAKVEPGLVDKMLARAQELGPDGFIPYGRVTGIRKFEPNLKDGGTYSGRHAPYLVASLIHGGPRLFTENCKALYTKGPLGGLDQGHATQSLSTTWGLIAAALSDPQALERHMEALRWKFTMLRCFDGGFGWNAYRLEYQGGEGLLPNYLRSGAYLVVLNAHRHNLAITGAPEFRAKSFPDLPPVCDADAVALGYYQRNWGVAAEVLGTKAPASLQSGLKRLLAMGKGKDTREELYGFLKTASEVVAQEILAIQDFEPLQKHYLAEMVLGVDIRLTLDLERQDNKEVPGSWKLEVEAQHPLAGYFQGADAAEREQWRKNPPLPMEGTVEIVDAAGKPFGNPVYTIPRDCGKQGWQTTSLKSEFKGPLGGPIPLVAKIRYKVGNLTFNYDRRVTAGGVEAGSAEKQRKVINDRIVWVKGRILRDVNNWSATFHLPSGQYIGAATQGGALLVTHPQGSWIAPNQGTVPAGTDCELGFSSGWQAFEARVAAIRMHGPGMLLTPKSMTANGRPLDRAVMENFDRTAGQVMAFPDKDSSPIAIEVELAAPERVRAIDMRLKGNGDGLRMGIEAQVDGKWQLVFQGRPGERSSAFLPVTTQRLRIQLSRSDSKKTDVELQELRVIRQAT